MNDLSTVLRQRILIVYSDIEWRDEMFSKVLDTYPHDMIVLISVVETARTK